MRIRTVKPEFWRSEDVAAFPWELRLLFVGLWSYVDDNGVGIDDYRLIVADLFALDEDQPAARELVREGLARLSLLPRQGSRESLLLRYEVDGRRYLYITGWYHQRVDKPNKARYPLPPSDAPTRDDGGPRDSLTGDSRETRESPAPVTEEQSSKRIAPSRAAGAAEPDGFAEFYDAYPRKRERKKAVAAYRAALRAGAAPPRLLQAAQSYALANRGKKLEYVKYPASWLNAGAYDDEPEQVGLALVAGGAHVADPVNGVYWEQ